MNICTYTYIHTYIYTCTHKYKHTYSHTHMRTQAYVVYSFFKLMRDFLGDKPRALLRLKQIQVLYIYVYIHIFIRIHVYLYLYMYFFSPRKMTLNFVGETPRSLSRLNKNLRVFSPHPAALTCCSGFSRSLSLDYSILSRCCARTTCV